MTTGIAVARTALFDALQTAAAGSPWRVHRVPDVAPAAPVMFIDSPTLSVSNGSIVTISFPVVIITDGSVTAQIEALDDLLAAAWTAASTVGNVTDSRPAVLDVGGPSLRAQIINVDMDTTAKTLCPPTLLTVSA